MSIRIAGVVVIPALVILGIAASAMQQALFNGPGPRAPSLSFPVASGVVSADHTSSTHHHYRFIAIEIKHAVANSINNEGLVSGYYQDSKKHYHGFVWRDGGFETVDYPGATDTLLFGLNNRGVSIGYYADTTTQHTVTYSVHDRTWTALPDIPDYPLNEGYGINDHGVAVGVASQVAVRTSRGFGTQRDAHTPSLLCPVRRNTRHHQAI